MKKYDLVVIGSGVGLTVLSQASSYGLKVALVESGKMGGTCLTRGCIPTKVLVHPMDVIREAQHAKKVGVHLKVEKVDWDLIAERMWSQIDESKQIDAGLSHAPGIDVYKGVGEFTGEYEMKVKLIKGGYSEPFQAERFVISSGARTFIPPVKDLEKVDYITSESFFGEKFPKKPWKSLIILGGGVIAAEFAHIFSTAGTEVTIIEMLPRLVSNEEPEISEFLLKNMQTYMKVHLGKKAIAAKKDGKNKVLIIEDVETGEKSEVKGEEILVATGLKPNSDLLKVENTGVETDKRGWIITNEYLETNKENIWCIGDANGKYLFRHTGNQEAEVCVNNIFARDKESRVTMDYSAVPWAIFTHPQIAHVGITQTQAIEGGHQIFVAKKYYSSVAKGFAMGYAKGDVDDGFVKLIVDRSRKILGAHIVGPHAAALIQSFVYLMNAGYQCVLPDEEGKPRIVESMACPDGGSIRPIYKAQVIHPSISEVAGWAIGALRPVNIQRSGGHKHNH
ncbi:MAG: dihydrolipoyl dehydrogenase family protein [Candidatus Hodarchaeota archaeon]